MNFSKNLPEKLRTHDWVLFFLLFVGACLRFYGLSRTLGTTGVGGFDEGVGLRWYSYAPFDFIMTTYYLPHQGHHVFHSILVHLMIVLFGEGNEIAIRMPDFLLGIGSLWLIYQIAFQLSDSLLVARVALLAAVMCPTHIAYSQTARGYSLVIFFSAAMIYSSIKLLETRNYLKWGGILTLSGFLLTYTTPINVFFVFGLALWLAAVLFFPAFRAEYGLDWADAKPKVGLFITAFLIMGLLTLAAYWPVLDQVQQASKGFALQFNNVYGDHPIYIDALIMMEQCLLLVFSGTWKWLLPILALGILLGPIKGLAIRILPVIIFLVPFILSLVTKIVGYPRVYLYNLPLFMVFFGAGTVWLVRGLVNNLPRFFKEQQAVYGLGMIFMLPQGFYLASEYYPSLETFSGKVYQQQLESQTKPNDLIFVSDVRHYLYARPVFKDRLTNIVTGNRLSGIKIISANRSILENFLLHDGRKGYPLFNALRKTLLPPEKDLVGGRKLFTVPILGSKSIVKEDFEVSADLDLVFGKGRWAANNENYFEGKRSLALTPASDQEMAIRLNLPEVHIERKSYLVMCWGAHRPETNNWDGSIFVPALRFNLPEDPDLIWQVRMGRVNQGMKFDLSESADPYEVAWVIGALTGVLPAGNYKFSIILKAFAGKPVLYDGLNLFLLEMG